MCDFKKVDNFLLLMENPQLVNAESSCEDHLKTKNFSKSKVVKNNTNKIIKQKHNKLSESKVTSPLKKTHKSQKPSVNNTKYKLNISSIPSHDPLEKKCPDLGEIVKLEREKSDEDVDIDVDEFVFESSKNANLENKPEKSSKISSTNQDQVNQSKCAEKESFIINGIDLSEYDSEAVNCLFECDIPDKEKEIDENVIDDIERIIHKEYFKLNKNSNKNPEKYLLIRNSILSNWKRIKPKYLNKSECKNSIRVNNVDFLSISKIHKFLEQTGAINFGCEKVKYERPLFKLLDNFPTSTTKSNLPKRKIKNKFSNTGKGGCTLTHGENGEIIETLIIEKEPEQTSKIKVNTKKLKTYLIQCRSFSEDSQKFMVKLNLATLLHMDFHAHSSTSEVMGLLGGYWFPDTNILKIVHYEPCKNQAGSTTHCDMCPVSQARASSIINNMDLTILGWFHSHPTFAPEPSQQDLDTQRLVQKWIGQDKPCIGIILSPFTRRGTSSPWTCMTVENFGNNEIYLPYKLETEIVYDDFDLESFLTQLKCIYNFLYLDAEESGANILFSDKYFEDLSISYMEKFLTSASATLQKIPLFTINLRKDILDGIKNCQSTT